MDEVWEICERLLRDSNALSILLLDKNGLAIAHAGGERLDVKALSELFSGSVAATAGVAKLLEQKEFSAQFHAGENTHVHLRLVARWAILVVLFDARSSLGLVRLRSKRATEELVELFDRGPSGAPPPAAAAAIGVPALAQVLIYKPRTPEDR